MRRSILHHRHHGPLMAAFRLFGTWAQSFVFNGTDLFNLKTWIHACKLSSFQVPLIQSPNVLLDVVNTFASELRRCDGVKALSKGKHIHQNILECGLIGDRFLGNLLVYMYGKCGALKEARIMFDSMADKNSFSWNIMLATYIDHGQLEDALLIFQAMSLPNTVSWTTIICAYADQGKQSLALLLFEQMQLAGLPPDRVTFVSLIDACTSNAALIDGTLIHSHIKACGFESDIVVSSALINFYGKCGNLMDAYAIFRNMPKRNIVSWNSIIAAYAQHGYGEKAIQMYHRLNTEGIMPTDVTFLSLLFACNNARMVDEGYQWLISMSKDGCVEQTLEHHNCIVDLLGRTGELDVAEALINSIPFGANSTSWKALLGSCLIFGDIVRGKHVAMQVVNLDPEHPAAYVLLSNMCAL